MNLGVMDEEDDIDPALAEAAGVEMPTGRPNVPRNPDDPREKIKQYLMSQEKASQLRQDPAYRAMERAPAEAINESNRSIDFAKLLNQSANQFGSLGGKVASSAPLDQFSKGLKESNQNALGSIMGQRQAAAGDEDRQLKIKQYLANKQQADETLAANQDFRNKQLKALGERNRTIDDNRQAAKDEKKTGQDRDFAFKLSKDYADDPTSKNTAIIRQVAQRAETSAANPSAANDMALVYSLMKANDPPSTVREGEFAAGSNLGSVDEKILSLRDKVVKGTMNPKIRAGILKSIQDLAQAQEKSQQNIDNQYLMQAQKWGVDPELVLGSRKSKFVEPGTTKIKVSDGKETMMIDPADLDEAALDGFKEVK